MTCVAVVALLGKLPSIEDVREFRQNPDVYSTFCTYMLSAVVGKLRWKIKVMEQPISAFVKPGLEAFAILLYANGHPVWQEKYEPMEVANNNVVQLKAMLLSV